MTQRRINKEGIDLIKSFEGFSSRVYLCPASKPTIGYGHLVREGEKFPEVISVEIGENILRKDLDIFEKGVQNLTLGRAMTDNQFSAMVSFAFNVGLGNFSKSTLLKRFMVGDIIATALEFDKWIWANKKKFVGLLRRRKAEGLLFLS